MTNDYLCIVSITTDSAVSLSLSVEQSTLPCLLSRLSHIQLIASCRAMKIIMTYQRRLCSEHGASLFPVSVVEGKHSMEVTRREQEASICQSPSGVWYEVDSCFHCYSCCLGYITSTVQDCVGNPYDNCRTIGWDQGVAKGTVCSEHIELGIHSMAILQRIFC